MQRNKEHGANHAQAPSGSPGPPPRTNFRSSEPKPPRNHHHHDLSCRLALKHKRFRSKTAMSDDEQDLLRLLEAHGQQFMASFDSSVLPSKRKPESAPGADRTKRRRMEERSDNASSSAESPEQEEEWSGISDSASEVEDEDDVVGMVTLI